MTPITRFTLRRSVPSLLLAALIAGLAVALSGCGGGGASLPTATTPVIDGFTVNGAAVVFSGTAVPVVPTPTNAAAALVCTAHDPDHSPLTFTWSGINGTFTTLSGVSTAGDTPTTDGDTLVTCTVTNARGDTVSRTVTLRAGTPAAASLTVLLSAASGVIASGKTDLLTAVAAGGTPTYHFSVASGTGSVAQSATNPAQATFTAPAVAETDTVLCYVTDTQGRSATATAVISVQ